MRLNFQEFVEEVVNVAQEILGADYVVGKREVTKMNGIKLTGVSIAPKVLFGKLNEPTFFKLNAFVFETIYTDI